MRRPTARHASAARPARGFSLVEVLIGILVLALGLLGIGAIIPVVVREQRLAADATQGAACAADVRATLLRHPEFSAEPVPSATGSAGHVTWDAWARDENWSGPFNNTNAHLWEGWDNDSTVFDPVTGELMWFDATLPTNLEHRLPLRDRLWPAAGTQVVRTLEPGTDPYRPQFVWDLVGRRVQFGDQYARVVGSAAPGYAQAIGRPDVIQAAVFVRRIDLAIRTPRTPGVTLLDVLIDSARSQPVLAQADWRFPVAVTPGNTRRLMQNAGPSTNPAGAYADPVFLDHTSIFYDPATPDRIRVARSVTPDVQTLVSQTGQKLVDNLGNVHTVRRLEDDPAGSPPGRFLMLERPVPSWVVETDSSKPQSLRQIVFMPQVPVAVEIITITRPVAN